MNDYDACVRSRTADFWYIKTKCYAEKNITDFFYEFDLCIYNSDVESFLPQCKIKLDFDFENAPSGFDASVMLKGDNFPIFKVYDSCIGAWVWPEENKLSKSFIPFFSFHIKSRLFQRTESNSASM